MTGANETTGHEPLSDAQLEAFRQTADDARYVNTFWSGQYAWTVARLLAEVERLRAALTQEQREHANCEQFHHEVSMAKNTAMRGLMDAYVELAESGDFDAASDEIRARVRDLLNRAKPDAASDAK